MGSGHPRLLPFQERAQEVTLFCPVLQHRWVPCLSCPFGPNGGGGQALTPSGMEIQLRESFASAWGGTCPALPQGSRPPLRESPEVGPTQVPPAGQSDSMPSICPCLWTVSGSVQRLIRKVQLLGSFSPGRLQSPSPDRAPGLSKPARSHAGGGASEGGMGTRE